MLPGAGVGQVDDLVVVAPGGLGLVGVEDRVGLVAEHEALRQGGVAPPRRRRLGGRAGAAARGAGLGFKYRGPGLLGGRRGSQAPLALPPAPHLQRPDLMNSSMI